MQSLRDIIAPADLSFSSSLVSFWWTAAFLLLLRKAFSVFPVNLTTSLAENGRRNILKTSISISLNLLLHFWIPLSRLPRTSVLHFWTVPPGPFLEPHPQNKVPILALFLTHRFWHWESRDTLWFPVGSFYLPLSTFETSIPAHVLLVREHHWHSRRFLYFGPIYSSYSPVLTLLLVFLAWSSRRHLLISGSTVRINILYLPAPRKGQDEYGNWKENRMRKRAVNEIKFYAFNEDIRRR